MASSAPRPHAVAGPDDVSCASRFVFAYMLPVMARAVRRGRVCAHELPPLGARDDPGAAYAAWLRTPPGTSVPARLHALYWRTFWYAGALFAVTTAGSLAAPVALHALLASIADGDAGARPLASAAALAAAVAAQAATIHVFWFEASRVGLHAQYVLTADVLAKALALSPAARAANSRGKLTNILAIDACRINDSFVLPFLHWYTWGAAVPAAVAAWQLLALLGAAGAVPLALTLGYLPLAAAIARASKRSSEAVQVARDARGRLIAEAVSGVATLKVLGATAAFGARIEAARATEVRAMATKQYLGVAGDFLGAALPVATLAATFGALALARPDAALDAATAFAAVAWAQALAAALRGVPTFLGSLVDVRVSLARLRGLLDGAEDADVGGLPLWAAACAGDARAGRAAPAAADTACGAFAGGPGVVSSSNGAAAAVGGVAIETPRTFDVPPHAPVRMARWLVPAAVERATRVAARDLARDAARDAADDAAEARDDAARKAAAADAAGAGAWWPRRPWMRWWKRSGSGVAGDADDDLEAALLPPSRESLGSAGDGGDGRGVPADAPGGDSDDGGGGGVTTTSLVSGATPAISVRCATIGWMVAGDDGVGGGGGGDADGAPAKPGVAVAPGAVAATAPTAPPRFVPVLRGVTFDCAPGSLTLVVGPVGAGKSALVAAVAGDAAVAAGAVAVAGGAVAYVPQTPWIRAATVRENITFGARFDAALYAAVSAAVALDDDATAWPDGHDAVVGDAGVTLSGGQRARVALARALYSDAPVVVLDDVLSALDAATGQHVWAHALQGLLRRRGRTVLLATHAVQYATRGGVDAIVTVAADGTATWVPGAAVAAAGGVEALCAAVAGSTRGAEGPAAAAADGGDGGRGGGGSGRVGAAEAYARGSLRGAYLWRYVRSLGAPPFLVLLLALYVAAQAGTMLSAWWMVQWTTGGGGGGALAAAARVPARGGGGGSAAAALAWDARPWPFLDAAAPCRAEWVMGTARSVAAAAWRDVGGPPAAVAAAATPSPSPLPAPPHPAQPAGWYASVYVGINGGLALLTLLRMALLAHGALRAATALHNAALRGVLGAPLAFFSANPGGRVANRLLADVATVDTTLRYAVSALAAQVFALVGALTSVALAAPAALAVAAPLGAVYYVLGARYRVAARDLRRLTSTAKSPLLTHFAECLRGAGVIRAAGPAAATAAVGRHLALCAAHARAYLAYWALNEFISVALEGLGVLVVLAAAVAAAASAPGGGGGAPGPAAAAAAAAGFGLSFALQLPSVLMWLVRQAALLETDGVALERLCEYAALEGEEAACAPPPWPPWAPPAGAPPDADGAAGGLAVDGLRVRYAPHLPPALAGLCLAVPRGARVAVVGRTGAGKSTLVAALLRLVRAEAGGVSVGGCDLAPVPLSALRAAHVTGVLQEACLFSGTLRANLAPPPPQPQPQLPSRAATDGRAGAGDDGAAWAALAAVGMAGAVAARRGGLDDVVDEGGANWSAGERQLLCLARALLRVRAAAAAAATAAATRGDGGGAGTLMVVDEPTASVHAVVDAAVHDVLLGPQRELVAAGGVGGGDGAADGRGGGGGLPPGVTLLVVCHRLAHVRRFDVVAVVEHGTVAEVGAPAALCARPDSRLRRLLDEDARAREGGRPAGGGDAADGQGPTH